MTMTDPIADMLTRMRNANVAMHDTVRMPSSKLKEALAAILSREGYIEGFERPRRSRPPGPHARDHDEVLPERKPDDLGLRRVSKPGLRVYTGSRQAAPRPRRTGRGGPVDQPGAHDRP